MTVQADLKPLPPLPLLRDLDPFQDQPQTHASREQPLPEGGVTFNSGI